MKRPKRPPIEVEVRLLAWAPRGWTSAPLDGRSALIDRGIPGELVTALIDRTRRDWRGRVTHVKEASPDRVLPPCPYVDAGCGGCQWQHLRYAAQTEAKRQQMDALLDRAGVETRVRYLHGMSDPWHYRHTAAIALGWEAGFRPRGRRGIVELHDCLIAHPFIGNLCHELNGLLRSGALPNYHGKVWLDVTVVGSSDRPRLQIVIQGISGLTLDSNPELPSVAERIDRLSDVEAVAFRHRSGAAHVLTGPAYSQIEIDGRSYVLPAGSFSQTNPAMVAIMQRAIAVELSRRRGRHLADVYGGIGTFGLPVAALVDRLTLIELDPQAAWAAKLTADSWGLTNVNCLAVHAEKAIPGLKDVDVAIVDPPRSGLGTTVTDAIRVSTISTLFYVSCAPATLAGDLAELTSGGFQVQLLELFDFYPQTYHVEALAVLAR